MPGEPTRVLIVPRVDITADSLQLSDLALTPALVSAVGGYLEPRRLLSMQIQIDEPLYQGLMVTARVRAMAGIRPESIREAAVQALYAYINPVTGELEVAAQYEGYVAREDLHNSTELSAMSTLVLSVPFKDRPVLSP